MPTKIRPGNRLPTKKAQSGVYNTIATNGTVNLQTLCLSHHNISQIPSNLSKMHPIVTSIDLSHNSIDNLQQLDKLSTCTHLQSLRIRGNPFCHILNYIYRIMLMNKRLTDIDGLKLGPSLTKATINKWQKNTGDKIIKFLLNKCCMLRELSKYKQYGTNKKSMKHIHKQLLNISLQLSREQNETNFTQRIRQSNQLLSDKLVYENPRQSTQEIEMQQIQMYWLQEIVKQLCISYPEILYHLLADIEINGQQHEDMMVGYPELSVFMLAKQIGKQFRKSEQILFMSQDKQFSHLTSIDTALDSQVGEKYNASSVHFSLDQRYLQVAINLINREVKDLISQFEDGLGLSENTDHRDDNQNRFIEKYIGGLSSDQCQHGCEEYHHCIESGNELQTFRSQLHSYTNPHILNNILDYLSFALKKICLRQLIQRMCRQRDKCELLLLLFHHHSINNNETQRQVKQQAFSQLVSYTRHLTHITHKLQLSQLKRTLFHWKNIKNNKQKLLKQIINRKARTLYFLTNIVLEKWRINARSAKLKQMADRATNNFIVCGSTKKMGKINKVIPQSKQGINIAYKQIIRKYSMKQLRRS